MYGGDRKARSWQKPFTISLWTLDSTTTYFSLFFNYRMRKKRIKNLNFHAAQFSSSPQSVSHSHINSLRIQFPWMRDEPLQLHFCWVALLSYFNSISADSWCLDFTIFHSIQLPILIVFFKPSFKLLIKWEMRIFELSTTLSLILNYSHSTVEFSQLPTRSTEGNMSKMLTAAAVAAEKKSQSSAQPVSAISEGLSFELSSIFGNHIKRCYLL